jgi:MFS family permease
MVAPSMPSTAALIVRRYYLYAGTYTLAASVIWGINTLFLLDAGLTITEVFVANAAFSLGTTLFEIPTGVMADTMGRRASFLVSLLVLSSTTVLYVWLSVIGGDVVAFSVVSALMGLGFTFYSGAMEAWLVDGATASGFTGGFDRVFSRAQIVSGAAMLIGTVGGGLLGQIHLAIPFLVRAGLLIALFGMAFRGMHDIGFTPRAVSWRTVPGEANRIARLGVRFGWKQPSLRLLILAAAVQNGFFFWAWYAWQPYFLQLLERDAVWVAGVVAALLASSMMIGNAIVEFVSRWCGKRTTLLLWAGAVFGLSMTGVGLVSAFVPALLLLMVAGIAMGVQMPVRQAFVHGFVPGAQRATVVSFDSMVAGGFSLVGQAGLGRLADRRGYSAGYILGGALTLVAVPLLVLVRRRRDPEDRFAGTAPAVARACAADGLPAIANVDTILPAEQVGG